MLIKKIYSLALASLTVATASALISFLSKSNPPAIPVKKTPAERPKKVDAGDIADFKFECCSEDIWF